jgi:hypothetical protein
MRTLFQCIHRLGCANDIRCENALAAWYTSSTKEVHIPNLLPASHYEIVVASQIFNKVFNVTTKNSGKFK